MTDHVLGFLAVSLLLIVTPGQDMALVMRNTLLGGRASGIATSVGVAVGLALWAFATSAGVAAILVASEPVFAALKIAGAAYLVFLGLHAVYAAAVGGSAREPRGEIHATRRSDVWIALRQGLVSNLGNPKIAVFFTSLLPQFTLPGDTSFASLLALGGVFCGLTLAWLVIYAACIAKAGVVLRRPRVRRTIEGLVGAVLVGLGLRLALR